MRRVAISAILLVAVATARPAGADPGSGHDFWRNVLEPHAAEVQMILHRTKEALQEADAARRQDYDPTGQLRMKLLRQLRGMLRYAHRLAPDNVDVLGRLAQADDELGHTRQAIALLQAAIRIAGPDHAGPELAGRLGAIYLRLGRVDDAIRYLRIGRRPLERNKLMGAEVLVHLSNALAERGEMEDAIDVLANSLPTQPQYYSDAYSLVSFALAVQYDRDEQLGAAFDVLDRMQTALQSQFGMTVQRALSAMQYAPPEDQHYYQALLYEVTGHYPEARAEWALYAADPDLPYRSRALAHVAAIDALRRAPKRHHGIHRVVTVPP